MNLLLSLDLPDLFVGKTCNRPQTRRAGNIRKIGERAKQLVAFTQGVKFIKIVIMVVFKRLHPGLFSFARERLEELGNGVESIGLTEVDALQLNRLVEHVKEDKDLFF